jgi:23S rRNA (pseudouridine1915-N3)-methyltransferase
VGGREAGEGRLKLRVLSVGKDRSGLFQPAVEEYAKRLRHHAKLELVELPEAKTHDARVREGQALLGKLRPADWVCALDERGQQLDSVSFASALQKAQNASRDAAFLIGGDEGLSEEVRARADLVLSLSRLTLPHRLARVVLMEQLYRGFTILRGEPYHRA